MIDFFNYFLRDSLSRRAEVRTKAAGAEAPTALRVFVRACTAG
jgi:hypothetical protein